MRLNVKEMILFGVLYVVKNIQHGDFGMEKFIISGALSVTGKS